MKTERDLVDSIFRTALEGCDADIGARKNALWIAGCTLLAVRVGDINNLRAPDYDPNPSVNSWLRGGGKGGESYPGYVPGYRGKK